MAITPSSHLKLLKCEIEIDNKNQLTFANAIAQYNYFNSLNKLEVDNFTYLRKDNVIRYNAHIDSIIQYNYVMYQNTNYSNKWFYAFITKMEYVSDTLTFIYIKEDPFQTWQFDLTYKRCFVEREHTNDDGIGKNTIDEGLELGEFVANSQVVYNNFNTKATCIGYTKKPSGTFYYSYMGTLFSGVEYQAFQMNSEGNDLLKNFLDSMVSNGLADNIVAIFQIPEAFVPIATGSNNWMSYIFGSDNNSLIHSYIYTFVRGGSIDGYTPKNNKLLVSPYNYLMVDNGAGNFATYQYELFQDSPNISFTIRGIVCPGCSITLIPHNYKLKKAATDPENYQNYAEQLNMGKLGICAWTTDAYTNWLAQNSFNIDSSNLISIGSILVGGAMVASGAGAIAGGGMIAGGIGGIYNNVKQEHQAHFLPNNLQGNLNGGDIMSAISKVNYTFYNMSVKAERARCIDEYFSMFGYKTSRVKVPNITGRSNWNYVKTIDANIEGYIPQESLQEIKDMFNTGVTFWHTTQYFLDYSRTNSIVS